MNLTKGQIIIIGTVFVLVLVFVLGLLGIIPGFKKESGPTDPNYPVTQVDLNLWGVEDDYTVLADIIKGYQDVHKNVRINYKKFNSPEEYESALVNALAENSGPDIFMVHNSWLSKHKGKMLPSYSNFFTPAYFKQVFPDIISNDFVSSEGAVYAAPLYLDSLALIYNKDIFNKKGIIYPPKNWDEFVQTSSQIKEIGLNKNIILAGTALGGAGNVNNLTDILSVLAFQSGSEINKRDGGVRLEEKFLSALSFYIQFSDPNKSFYTWNEGLGNSLELFSAGKVGMIFDNYRSLAKIKSKNSFLKVEFSSLPQFNSSSPVNFPNYWGLAVSNRSKNSYVAWDFIRYITVIPEINSAYLAKAQKLPALLALINKDINGANSSFLRSFLTARDWQSPGYFDVDYVFKGMVSDIISGKLDLSKSVRAAESAINLLYK